MLRAPFLVDPGQPAQYLGDVAWCMRPAESREVFVPRELAERGSPVDLCEQFVLSRTVDAPDGWSTVSVGAWRLAYHPTLPVVSIDYDDGPQVGWLLGYPITSDGELVRAGEHVTMGSGVEPVDLVGELGGRFLAIFVQTATPSVYPDACGTYSSVYCPTLEMVASTPGLIPYDTTTTDRTELIEQLGIPWNNSMYPVGLTPRHGIHRLLPHHHLDLDRWVMTRHGPDWGPRGSTSVDDAVDQIGRITTRNIGAIREHYPCYLPLTAGHDSRMLLACARQWASDLELYTLEFPALDAANDCHVAAQIASRLGLSHRHVPLRPASDEDLELWMYRVSCSVGELRGWQATTSYRALDPNRVRLLGNIGDISRRAYWTPEDTADGEITLDRLVAHALAHCARPSPAQVAAAGSPVVREHVERWVAHAGTTDALRLLDMLFVENRLGAWAGIFPYAEYYGPGFTIFPMSHRDVVTAMMQVSDQVRLDETLLDEVTEELWPELSAWPYNTPTRQLRIRQFPRRVERRLRSLASSRR